MNQGGNIQTLAPVDPKSVENQYGVDASQVQMSSYHFSTPGSDSASWTMHRASNQTTENVGYPNSAYHYPQPMEPAMQSIQDGSNAISYGGSSASGTTNLVQGYSGYATHPISTDPYGYGSTGYPSYYSGYQQQPGHSYSQPIGAYQNTGAPYQPLSSFQNTGSYAGSASYSGTYYNPADYQTSGGYPITSYSNQTTSWNEGNYANYTSNPYSNYPPNTIAAHSSNTATATSLHYRQQWADYYSQTEVTCAPGTEHLSVSGAPSQVSAVPGVTSGIPTSNSQPPPFIQPWRPEANLSQTPSVQPVSAFSGAHDNYWKHSASSFQSHQVTSVQPNYQSPLNANLPFNNIQDQQKATLFHGQNPQYTAHQTLPTCQQIARMVPSQDTRRVSKLQIPTNPRIASNLPLGLVKTDKDNSMANAAAKPAYVSVSVPKLNSSAADSMLKPGTFPPSLRGYVERTLACCKDDNKKAACQAALKEMITKATADGTLYTRDWDTEPLLPVSSGDVVNNELEGANLLSFLPRRTPGKRSKSRWEPLPDENPVEKSPSVGIHTVKFGGWGHFNEKDKKPLTNFGSKMAVYGSFKSPSSEQKSASKNGQRPFKRQRFSNGVSAGAVEDDSSDSDKEQSLTPYYSGAVALADSAEEKKRRESRSKRFDKGQGFRRENNFYKPKNASSGNLYARRATAMVLSKNFDDGGSRAVEDIDWDALTVKGTCQELEKRYLRLTSAPDPSTVRPEDVLEKALLMVQSSQKNYLYKCDQLKSIRQDLTVQRIRNQLTVKVYETHARLALEVGDLPEYNQCQSQLKILYGEGIKGCHMEFAAYNLLCVMLHSSNNRELLSSMSRLYNDAKKDDAFQHALAVRAAFTSGNYVKFFRLYKGAPNLNSCLMDLHVEKMRYKAVSCMSRAYRPTVPVSYIAQVLGFTGAASNEGTDEKDTDALEECVEWLKAHGACITVDNNGETQLDTKASSSSLYMPEPEDAVAHGDPNLAVNDFFARTLS